MPELEEYVDEIRSVFETKWLTNMGEKHQQLEKELKKYLNIDHISLMVNGHMSIELSLQAFEFPKGGEVITTPFTFISTTHAIVRNGLTPVFCDIDPDTYCIDANKIEDLTTDKTVAIMPVHVYGNICDVEKIDSIAKKYKLKVIYDAAHAFGEKIKLSDGNERNIATFGDVSCFSFHATKVFNSIEGGAVCFSDSSLELKFYNLKNFGIRYNTPDYIEAVGANAKMNEFAAAMGLVNLRHLSGEIAKRKKVYERYCELLGNINGIKLNYSDKNLTRNYAYLPVLFDKKVLNVSRDDIDSALAKNNIFARKYFYPLTSDAQTYEGCFSSDGVNERKSMGKNIAARRSYTGDIRAQIPTPVAKEVALQVLTLPMYADLSLKDVDRICDIIIACLQK